MPDTLTPSRTAATATEEATYLASTFNPAHPDLPNAAGTAAQLANTAYIESLTRLVYYWGYPAVDAFDRTSCWELMQAGPGATLGLFPGAPKNHMGYLDDYMSPAQRKVVTPNNDTIYGVSFVDLRVEPVVVQTPDEVPKGQYWTLQLCDLFTTVFYQLGSASATPGGKFLLVGPDWAGKKPEGFIDVLRSPTHVAGIFGRAFIAHDEASKAQGRAILNRIGVVPLSQDAPGPLVFDCQASARNKVFPKGVTAEMVAADPDILRVRPVNPLTFWDDLKRALDANPIVSPDDRPMAEQARTLLALRDGDNVWRALIDRTTLAANAELNESAKYHEVGVDAGNGWQRQKNGGVWGTDWFGRAQAAVIYIYVNDYHEAVYFIRGTDAKATLLQGRYTYEIRFEKGQLPPVDRSCGGFWSLTMYDKDYYMLADSPNGRTNIGTVNLDANELTFAADGSLTLTLSATKPATAEAAANWLPAPHDQFALIVRTYVPAEAILNGTYKLPDVRRVT